MPLPSIPAPAQIPSSNLSDGTVLLSNNVITQPLSFSSLDAMRAYTGAYYGQEVVCKDPLCCNNLLEGQKWVWSSQGFWRLPDYTVLFQRHMASNLTLQTYGQNMAYVSPDTNGRILQIPSVFIGNQGFGAGDVDIYWMADWAPSVKTSATKLYVTLLVNNISMGYNDCFDLSLLPEVNGVDSLAILVKAHWQLRLGASPSSGLVQVDTWSNIEYAAAGVANEPITPATNLRGPGVIRKSWRFPSTKLSATANHTITVKANLDAGGLTTGTLYCDRLLVEAKR
jgi:hypothetical protein